jgi:riboflavin synthase
MFTGIVEEVGRMESVSKGSESLTVTVTARKILDDLGIGDSVAVDGVCQTVTRLGGTSFTFDTLAVSLKKTTLSRAVRGRPVNLERAVLPLTRMGGHFVQGHVQSRCTITAIRKTGNNVYLTVRLPQSQLHYCIAEGSIALDGISLTIAEIEDPLVTVNIIPQTFKETTLAWKKPGDQMNLETDLLGRYVERLLGAGSGAKAAGSCGESGEGLTIEKLKRLGF